MIRIVKTGDRRIEKFNARPAFPEEAEKAAASALAEIKARGDAAVLELVAKFEGFKAKNAKALKVDLSKVSEKGIDSKIVRERVPLGVYDVTGYVGDELAVSAKVKCMLMNGRK